MRRTLRHKVAAMTAILLGVGTLAAAWPGIANADETTIGYSALRSNWDANEPGLGPAQVTASDFGKLWDTTLPRPAGQSSSSYPNQIYAQPLVVANTVYAATEENNFAALDAATGALKWNRNLGASWTPTNCGDLVPHIGITSTPVYDPTNKVIYLVSRTSAPKWVVHAINPANGADVWTKTVGGSPSNGGPAFNSTTANQRPGLLLLNGVLYMGFGSYCDHQPYVGYVASLNVASKVMNLWATETKTATDRAGIWMSGGAPMSDGAGRIFVSTGNGISPSPSTGAPPSNLAESVIRLGINTNGTLGARDFFSPANNAVLDSKDQDLGSGGPAALPASFGTIKHQHLLSLAGKEGVLYLLDRDGLGGMVAGGNPANDRAVDRLDLGAGVWGRVAAFDGGSATKHFIYVVPQNRSMRAIRITPNGSNNPTMSVAGITPAQFGYSSGSPVVTSNGSDPSSALVWVVKVNGSSGSGAVLQAYPADPPSSGSWNPIFTGNLGIAAKFIQPATDGNRVFVGTRDGRVLGFGRPVTSAITGPSTEFGQIPVGTPSTKTVTLTASRAATINSIASDNPNFTVNTTGMTFPMPVAAGAKVNVPVTFTPSTTGSLSGFLVVMAGNPAVEYDFSLHGTGVREGLSASPASLNFGDVSTQQGAGLSYGVTISNTGTQNATITGITQPSAPYSVSGLPAVGTIIPPQGAVSVSIAFNPTTAGTYNDSLKMQAQSGGVNDPLLTIPLTGTGVNGSPQMTLSPKVLDFGNVQPGQKKTLTFTVTNTGTTVLTITKAAPPNPPFLVPNPLNEGQQLTPDQTLTISVTAAPSSASPANDVYQITSNDNTVPPQQTVQVKVNQGPWVGPISTPLGCMDLNGGAVAGASLVSSPCNAASTTQSFSLAPSTSTGPQKIHVGGPTNNLCLDTAGGATAAGTQVITALCNVLSTSQDWTWRTDDTLFNSKSSMCIAVAGGSTAANTPLQLAACAKNFDPQYWDLSAVQAARGEISSGVGAIGQYCMDDKGASTVDRNPIQLYQCNLTGAQIITHVGSQLRVLGKCVGVVGAGTTDGSLVDIYRCNASTPQVWVARSDGTILNQNSGKCLAVPGNVTTPGTQLTIQTCGTAAGQKWTIS